MRNRCKHIFLIAVGLDTIILLWLSINMGIEYEKATCRKQNTVPFYETLKRARVQLNYQVFFSCVFICFSYMME